MCLNKRIIIPVNIKYVFYIDCDHVPGNIKENHGGRWRNQLSCSRYRECSSLHTRPGSVYSPGNRENTILACLSYYVLFWYWKLLSILCSCQLKMAVIKIGYVLCRCRCHLFPCLSVLLAFMTSSLESSSRAEMAASTLSNGWRHVFCSICTPVVFNDIIFCW